jgi:type I restriction enzyme S subunit
MTATLSNLDKLKPNPHWAKLPLFNRKNWTRVRFGDVVENLNETCDPAEAGLERVIAMEHLEPGSLHIRAWGNVADGTTFTRRCRPGQVLFGKRRAYQRKVAVAEFDAVVSGDIYVLAPKGDRLLPELLPFLCLSERFFQHAVGTSAGSLSPRTNWSSLASFEVDLPPLDQQRRIAEILWAVDEMQRAAITLLENAKILRKTMLLSRFASLAKKYPKEKIREIGQTQLGRQRAPKYTTGRYSKPYLRVVNVLDGELDLKDVQEMDFDERDFARYVLSPGDILVTEGDITSPYNVGRSAIFRGEIPSCCFQNTLIRLRVGDKLGTDYAHFALQDALYRGVFAAVASTTTVSHLGSQRFGSVSLPIPPIIEQRKVCEEIIQHTRLVALQTEHSKQSTALVGQIIQALLGDKL